MKASLGVLAIAATVYVVIIAIPVLPMSLLLVMSGATSTRTLPPGAVPVEAIPAPAGPLLSDTTDLARQIQPWLGSPYVFGGNVVGAVDCSGFTVAIWRQRGVQLPRTAQGQYNVSQRVPPDQAAYGDLVFFAGTYDSRPDFISHVGIYLGSGVMVSAIQPVLGRQDLNSTYWRSHLVGFGRVPQ